MVPVCLLREENHNEPSGVRVEQFRSEQPRSHLTGSKNSGYRSRKKEVNYFFRITHKRYEGLEQLHKCLGSKFFVLLKVFVLVKS